MTEHRMGQQVGGEVRLPERFVAVMFAQTRAEANRFGSLLMEHGIPAQVQTGGEGRRWAGVPVLVPEVRLEEASDIVASSDFDTPAMNGWAKAVVAGPDEEDEEKDDMDDDFDDDFDDDDEEDDEEEEEEEDEDDFDDDDEFEEGEDEEDAGDDE